MLKTDFLWKCHIQDTSRRKQQWLISNTVNNHVLVCAATSNRHVSQKKRKAVQVVICGCLSQHSSSSWPFHPSHLQYTCTELTPPIFPHPHINIPPHTHSLKHIHAQKQAQDCHLKYAAVGLTATSSHQRPHPTTASYCFSCMIFVAADILSLSFWMVAALSHHVWPFKDGCAL